MLTSRLRRALVAFVIVTFFSVAFAAEPESERVSRVTPIVKAVRKTRDSIVTLKVVKPTSTKDVVGTGVIIDERGYVLTNYHVVRNHKRIKAYLRDGTFMTAELYVAVPSHDLAVLRVDTKKSLKALRLGPASDLFEGETVIAIGHPYGFTNTVSTGIVSATGRTVKMPAGETLTNLIQTTADINPGNSGGALLNINGELIGINVALRKGAQGIAFALNADTVQRVLSRHLSAKMISGLRHGLCCKEKVREEGNDRQKVIIEEVAEETPASKAGLREGDIIVSVGELKVANRFDVERALWDVEKSTITVSVERKGCKLDLRMKVGTVTAER